MEEDLKENKGGRPCTIDILDPNIRSQIELFGRLAATQQEIADYYRVDLRTVQRWFADDKSEFCRIYKKARSEANTSLRRVQMEKALSGDSGMLIWLGKQLLNQREPKDLNVDVPSWKELISNDMRLIGSSDEV